MVAINGQAMLRTRKFQDVSWKPRTSHKPQKALVAQYSSLRL